MLSLDEYLREAEIAHGHLCAGQVLGVRLAMLGLEKLGIEDPRGKTASAWSRSSKSTAAPPTPSP
jgi:formylmethanofuran dehydrogenase subunit E